MTGQWWSCGQDGRVHLRLVADEAATILGLMHEVREILTGAADDPIMQRLFPRAYLDPTEESAEQTWRALAGPDLLRERLDRLRRLAGHLEPVALGEHTAPLVLGEEAEADWMGALNDIRLTLGGAIGVSDDHAADDEPDDDDPQGPAWHLYHVLTYFHGELIDLLLDRLPEAGSDDI